MTVYSNYSGNYNGFRHIIADNELLTLWLADKVLDAVEDEDELKHDAIEVAQKRIG